jgi:hypothetical protein
MGLNGQKAPWMETAMEASRPLSVFEVLEEWQPSASRHSRYVGTNAFATLGESPEDPSQRRLEEADEPRSLEPEAVTSARRRVSAREIASG